MTTQALTTADAGVIVGVPMMDETKARAGALSPLLRAIARNYLAVRARAGEAILDSARYLAEARAAAKYGEWSVFLEATGTPEDTATRLIAIAGRAEADQQYAVAVRDGRLAFTAAFELLSAPAATQRAALESSVPTPATTIRKAKQDDKLRTSAELSPLPDADAQHRATIEAILKERHTPALIQQAYDHAAEIHDLALHNKMISLIDRATDETASAAAPPAAPTLAELDACMPKDLEKAGYYWRSAQPPTIAHNDGWTADAPTPDLALECAHDREKARGKLIALPPFPASDLQALMESISYILEMASHWRSDTRTQAAPALGLLRAIGRKALEVSES